jgi:polyhydroxybutyrate depolymerase
MTRLLPIVIALFVSLSALAQVPSLSGTITHEGSERAYRLYVPTVYDGSEAVPLVLNLHGYGSNAFQQELYGDFRRIADTANFIIVHPEGTLDPTNSQFWNSFGAMGGVDDVDFLSALIDSISDEYNIDAERIYSTGMSNGGFMSYKLACELGDRIAAIASVTGTMVQAELNACNPAHPTPILQVHGTNDPTVLYNGNPAQQMVAIESVVDFWVQFNNCNSPAAVTSVPDIDMTDMCTAEHYVYTGGDNGTSVEFFKIIGGAHTWPGSPAIIAFDVTNQDFSASMEIWRFFSQYNLTDVVSVEDQQTQQDWFTVFPNPSSEDITIRLNQPMVSTYKLVNTVGQLIDEGTIVGSLQLDIAKAGIYFLTISSELGTVTQKLIRE